MTDQATKTQQLREISEELKVKLLTAPDVQFDSSVKPLVEKWSSPPTTLEVLKVLDICVAGDLADGYVLTCIGVLYQCACALEQTNHPEVVTRATWRTASKHFQDMGVKTGTPAPQLTGTPDRSLS
jgi:hypothetical protein